MKHDGAGVLLLSRFTGAAREFSDAIHINPYAIESFADSIKFAIEMPSDEKKRRMHNMRSIIAEHNIYQWAGSIINELTNIKKMPSILP